MREESRKTRSSYSSVYYLEQIRTLEEENEVLSEEITLLRKLIEKLEAQIFGK